MRTTTVVPFFFFGVAGVLFGFFALRDARRWNHVPYYGDPRMSLARWRQMNVRGVIGLIVFAALLVLVTTPILLIRLVSS